MRAIGFGGLEKKHRNTTERLVWTDTDSPRCMLGKSSIIWSDKEQKEPISPHVISSFASRFLLLVNRTLNWCLLNWMSGSREDFVTLTACPCVCECVCAHARMCVLQHGCVDVHVHCCHKNTVTCFHLIYRV